MIKVKNIFVEDIENAGCNNGNYPKYEILFDNGESYFGVTCRCGRGCSETDCLPNIGEKFNSMKEFMSWLYEDAE